MLEVALRPMAARAASRTSDRRQLHRFWRRTRSIESGLVTLFQR
jgi:hypothetical protein